MFSQVMQRYDAVLNTATLLWSRLITLLARVRSHRGNLYFQLPKHHSPIFPGTSQHHSVRAPLNPPHFIRVICQDVRGDRWKLATSTFVVGVQCCRFTVQMIHARHGLIAPCLIKKRGKSALRNHDMGGDVCYDRFQRLMENPS